MESDDGGINDFAGPGLMRRVVVIAGPTASGKSAAALAIARMMPAAIINADAMQLYRDLRVLSARPDEAALAAVPHRLYGVLDGDEIGSAARWLGLAREAIDAAHAEGRVPLLVGGTGLYLKALMTGIAELPPIPASLRDETRARLAAIGHAAFHAELVARDPRMKHLHVNDTQRILRAAEVLAATGRSLADFHAATEAPHEFAFTTLVLMPEPEAAESAIVARATRMLDDALVEVRALLARNLAPDRPIMKAVGVPELARLARGEIKRADALAQLVLATRRYAKRQRTWFRHQIAAQKTWNEQFSESLAGEISTFIKQTG